MICTYWLWISVTGERETEQYKLTEPVRNVQCAVRRKTQEYSHSSRCVNLYGQVSGEVQGH